MFTLETLEKIFNDEEIVGIPTDYQIKMIRIIGRVLKEKYGRLLQL